MSRSRILLVVLGLCLSAAAVALLVRSIDLGAALRAVARASPAWLAAGIGLTVFGYYLRSLRWRAILAPHVRPRVGRLFSANMVGFLAVNILPARLGELVRAYVLARGERIATATVIGSVAVERILDLAFLVVFWALSLLFAPYPGWFRWSGYATVAATVGVGVGLFGLHAARGHASRWSEGILSGLPAKLRGSVSAGVSAFGAGIQILGKPGLLAEAGLWSAAAWVTAGAVFLCVGESLGMRLPLWSPLLLTFVVCVGISVPSSPGFIGVMEWACVLGLGLVGIGGPEGLAFALLYHVTQILPLLVLGTYFAVREHLTPSRMARAAGLEGAPERKK